MIDGWRDPQLYQVYGILLGVIIFGVAHSGAGAHPLNFTRTYHANVSHIIFVFQGAFDDVGDDFHLAMRMQRKTACRGDDVIIENAQRAKIQVLGIVIMVKREVPICLKPICFKMIAITRSNRLDQGGPP